MNKRQVKKKSIKTIYPNGTHPIYIKNGVKVYTKEIPEKMWMFFFEEKFPDKAGHWSIEREQWEEILRDGCLNKNRQYPTNIFIITDCDLRVIAESAEGNDRYTARKQIKIFGDKAVVESRYIDMINKISFDNMSDIPEYRHCIKLFEVYRNLKEEDFDNEVFRSIRSQIELTESTPIRVPQDWQRLATLHMVLYKWTWTSGAKKFKKFLESKLEA